MPSAGPTASATSQVHTYDADATHLNSTQLLSQASKQRVVSAQHRDVTMLMTSLHYRPQSRQLSWVELRRQFEFTPPHIGCGENECTSHHFIVLVIFMKKLSKLVETRQNSDKKYGLVFFGTRCICLWQRWRRFIDISLLSKNNWITKFFFTE